MSEKLRKIIKDFTGLKVLIVGDAILDIYIKGSIERVCREAPVPLFNVHHYEHQCGGAANTAINVATLGAEAYFLTVTGKDANGRELIEGLKHNKVNTQFMLQDKTRNSIAKKRLTASGNIVMRVDEGTTADISRICQQGLINCFLELYKEVDAVIVSDYGYGVITDSLIDELCHKPLVGRKPIIVDAKDPRRFKAIRPTIVKPNYAEAVHMLHIDKLIGSDRVKQIIEHGDELLDITGAGKVAVTLDMDGVIYFEKGKRPYRVLSVPHNDTKAIGAGDTFISALTLALASGLTGELSVEVASAAAAIVVEKEGTVGCTNEELKTHFNPVPKHVLNCKSMIRIVSDLKKKGKKIVFTNGCFDILHKGHVTLLEKAKQFGDVLIVGVNSDESIRKLKGNDRPINNLEDRLTVLAGLKSVDYLIDFKENSPVHLIKAIRPHVFVKGGDYTEDSIPEAPLVKKLGGVIQIVHYIEDHSTTHIINKIKETGEEIETQQGNYAYANL